MDSEISFSYLETVPNQAKGDFFEHIPKNEFCEDGKVSTKDSATKEAYETTIYKAPEMINLNQSGPFTDLWALGIIAYELYFG